ncbi:MAG: prolyl-tRNA synthetase associated domain-containing protein [Candidatus Buchananbacteria bacterium]
MKDIYQILNDLEIEYQKIDHPAVFTVEEAKKYDTPGVGHCKNLFLRNKKGDKHYLFVLPSEKRVDFKKLSETLNEDRLSFASDERLQKYLGLTAGSVSPFGIINDENNEVVVVLDQELFNEEKLGFHPNINTATLIINSDDLKKFIDKIGNKVLQIEI